MKLVRSGRVQRPAEACASFLNACLTGGSRSPDHLSEQPGRRQVAAAVGWLYSGLQVMHLGERALAHAHSASALRFIMEEARAYTIVDEHKMTLGARDFVLTPNGTWHEHGVEASGSPCMWQDGLDIPLVNALEANSYTGHPKLQQEKPTGSGALPATSSRPPTRPSGRERARSRTKTKG
jgi:gentisate 1,2-dioxygenase